MLNLLAYVFTYTMISNGTTVGTASMNNVPSLQMCRELGDYMKREMAANGVRVIYTCKKQ